MIRIPVPVEGIEVQRDLRAGTWQLAFAGEVVVLRPWLWGERRRLLEAATCDGVLDRGVFLAGLFDLLVEPRPQDSSSEALAAACLYLLGAPQRSPNTPLDRAEFLAVKTFGWRPQELDIQPAAAVDRLVAQVEPAGIVSQPEGEWTRILLVDEKRPARDETSAGAPLEKMLEVVAGWTGSVLGARAPEADVVAPPGGLISEPGRPSGGISGESGELGPSPAPDRERESADSAGTVPAPEPETEPVAPAAGRQSWAGTIRGTARLRPWHPGGTEPRRDRTAGTVPAAECPRKGLPPEPATSTALGRSEPVMPSASTPLSPVPTATVAARPSRSTAAVPAGRPGAGQQVAPDVTAPRSAAAMAPELPSAVQHFVSDVPLRPRTAVHGGMRVAPASHVAHDPAERVAKSALPSVQVEVHWPEATTDRPGRTPDASTVRIEAAVPSQPATLPENPFVLSELEERMADVLDRAAREAGVDLP